MMKGEGFHAETRRRGGETYRAQGSRKRRKGQKGMKGDGGCDAGTGGTAVGRRVGKAELLGILRCYGKPMGC